MSLGHKLIIFIASTAIATGSAVSYADELLTSERKAELAHMVKQDCGSCHGMTLKGGLGPALLPDDLKNKPTLMLENTVLFGRPGTAMPPWKSILKPQEVRWIISQLQKGKINEE